MKPLSLSLSLWNCRDQTSASEKDVSDSGKWPFHTPPTHAPTMCQPKTRSTAQHFGAFAGHDRSYVSNPKAPKIAKIKSHLKLSISLEEFNLAWKLQFWPSEFPTKKKGGLVGGSPEIFKLAWKINPKGWSGLGNAYIPRLAFNRCSDLQLPHFALIARRLWKKTAFY